ncbi:hypothetical protein [Pedobacter agri]|uniref:hypothetical protein n=1 Tax=Pedobacter agri TaxID=454586 RepID=UPI002786286D|nr:hypothetical protein [Pedobacter agri]MDQ1142275.1 protein-S-isoprenylcysteine O-methyltransferase Ste14 [Pedobacter agri]
MKTQQTLITSKQRITIILAVIVAILCVPLIAMQFTNEVNWTTEDFVAAGILLLSTGLAIELVIRNIKTGTSRTITLIIILIALFLIWTEMAVGIFGSPIAGS